MHTGIQRLSPPATSKGQRLNVDSKCPCGKGRNIEIQGVTARLGALPEVQCVQSTSWTERSAKIVGLVSR